MYSYLYTVKYSNIFESSGTKLNILWTSLLLYWINKKLKDYGTSDLLIRERPRAREGPERQERPRDVREAEREERQERLREVREAGR